jgi:hypothetical protein
MEAELAGAVLVARDHAPGVLDAVAIARDLEPGLAREIARRSPTERGSIPSSAATSASRTAYDGVAQIPTGSRRPAIIESSCSLCPTPNGIVAAPSVSKVRWSDRPPEYRLKFMHSNTTSPGRQPIAHRAPAPI